MPTGYGDHSYVYEIAKEIDADFPIYAVPWPEMTDAPPATMEAMAEIVAGVIRQAQASGPYHLFGYSSGGILTYMVAERLQAEGEEVALVGLLDTLLDPGVEVGCSGLVDDDRGSGCDQQEPRVHEVGGHGDLEGAVHAGSLVA